MSDAESDAGDDQAAAITNIVQPLRKQAKKLASKLEKLDAVVKALEKERNVESERREGIERQLAEANAGASILKGTLDAAPWRAEADRVSAELRAAEKKLSDTLDEQRVQLAAHAQVFQSTQTTVSSLSQGHSVLQVEQSDGAKRAAEELRALTTRLDHMRGEFAERVTHSFSESTAHADRLTQRLQQDMLKLEQDVASRAMGKVLSESTAAMQAEVHELRASNEELRRDLRTSHAQLQELREAQMGFVLKSTVRHACRPSAAPASPRAPPTVPVCSIRASYAGRRLDSDIRAADCIARGHGRSARYACPHLHHRAISPPHLLPRGIVSPIAPSPDGHMPVQMQHNGKRRQR